MKRFALFFVLLLSWPAFGQDLSIKGDGVKVVKVDRVIVVKEDATVVQSFPFTINAPAGAGLYFWTTPVGMAASDRGDSLQVTNGVNGQATVSVKAITPDLDKDGRFKGFLTKFYSVSFSIGNVPGPGPGPVPPPPPDPVIPAPIPLAGFRVLFVEEQTERAKLPLGQYNVMFGKTTRDWLDANCVKEGALPGYRIYDKDQSSAADLKHWQDALRRPRTSVPWVIISNGVTGFEGALPSSESECMALFQKYILTGRK